MEEQIKTDYICSKCNKKFDSKYTIARHLKKKLPCDKKGKSEYTEKKRTCEYCLKICSTYNVLYNHLLVCKKKKIKDVAKVEDNVTEPTDNVSDTILSNINFIEYNKLMEKKFEELKNQLDIQMNNNIELRKEIDKLVKNNRIIVNNNNNNYIGNINNINIVAYGKESCDHISDMMFKKIIDKGFNSVPFLIEHLHFNKDNPEYHNVYISNMRDNYVLVYDGEKWKLAEKDVIIDDMMDTKNCILSDKFDELIDGLSDKTKTRFKRFLDESDSSLVKEKIKNDIKLLLYNNKQIAENTRHLITNRT